MHHRHSHLHRFDGRLVADELCLQSLVFLFEIVDTHQVPAIVIRPHEQFLLLDPRLLVSNVPEKLVQGVGLVEVGLSMSSQIL